MKLMRRQLRIFLVLLLASQFAAIGCRPIQPWYLNESGDLSSYLETATELEYPDVQHTSLNEVTLSEAPLTLTDPDFTNWRDLTLEEAVSITLHNSKVLRTSGLSTLQTSPQQARVPDGLIRSAETTATVYDPAIFESDSVNGVEAALSEFDAQLVAGLNGLGGGPIGRRTGVNQIIGSQTINRRQNINNNFAQFSARDLQQETWNASAEISKKTAHGSTWAVRSILNKNNTNNNSVAQQSVWSAELQAEVHFPILRGRGTQVNRVPVMIARTNTDIALADFEANVRNLVSDVENAYWNLHCAYRNLDLTKRARDNALATWRVVESDTRRQAHEKARSREQYYRFRANVEVALNDLQRNEQILRYLMGWAVADSHVLRPIDETTTAPVHFDWREASCEAVCRLPEIREQKWRIKQANLTMIAAKNQLLPELNAFAQFNATGLGDQLTRDGAAPRFPADGSTALNELTSGDFQEINFGFEFFMPIGFRAELAGVRNAQLNIARQHARLEDMELNVSHQLAQSLRDLDTNYHRMRSQFNRWRAAQDEVDNLRTLFEGGLGSLDILLDAQIRITDAEASYYTALCEYQRSIAGVHYRKGSLLEYNNICLNEGPWPAKAYWDAMGHARRRAAAHHMNYGWSRPKVISQGPISQQGGGGLNHGGVQGEIIHDGAIQGEVIQGEIIHGTPTPATSAPPIPSAQSPDSVLQRPTAQRQAPRSNKLQLVNFNQPVAQPPAPTHESVANPSHRQAAGPFAK